MARIEKWDEVHGNQAPDERMMAFLDSATDQYAILQLRRSEDTLHEPPPSFRKHAEQLRHPGQKHEQLGEKRQCRCSCSKKRHRFVLL